MQDTDQRPIDLASLDPLEAARILAPGIRERAEHIERERRVPDELTTSLAEAGLFRLCVPRTLGGREVDVATLVHTIEAIAHADGAVGWCVMIGATTGVLSAYLPEPVAREIYGGTPGPITGGVFAPLGTAVPERGGYRVSGRWPFASGCEHCAWLMGGCVINEDGVPRQHPDGQVDARLMIFPAAAARIVDTWTVSGLRGTGSHDITVADLFVPAERAVSLTHDRPRHAGPLYRFPVFGLLALGIAGVALGIARAAIDDLITLAAAKQPTGSRRRLADRALVQFQVAEAEATWRAARAFLFDAVGAAWNAAVGRGDIGTSERALLRLAATHTATSAAKVVDAMYTAGGGTSIYAASPLQRQFRDVHVLTQHIMVAQPTYEVVGRVLLGLDTDTAQL